jgi:AraC-like DNA-binding protein
MIIVPRGWLKIALLILMFTATCCTTDKHKLKWDEQDTSSPEVRKVMNGYADKIEKYYSKNPDSAIYYCHKLINAFNTDGMPYGVFNINTKLAEIYMNVKGDAVNAIHYHNEALKVMLLNKEREAENPYFFMDMGNIMLHLKLTQLAITNYRKSYVLAKSDKNKYAESVALNYLGQAYSNLQKYDSACFYYKKSLNIRKDILPLLEAQNYVYLARVFVKRNISDSILHYINKAQSSINRQQYTQAHMKAISLDYAIGLGNFVNVDIPFLRAEYYQAKQANDSTLYYYSVAQKRALALGDSLLPITTLYESAKILMTINHNSLAIQKTDSSFQFSVIKHDFQSVILSAKLLSELVPSKANFYQKKAMAYTDSLVKDEQSDVTLSNKILVITANSEDSLRYYQNLQNKTDTVIKVQTFSITGLIFLIVALTFVVYIVIKRHKQLKEEHLLQMEKLVDSLEKEPEFIVPTLKSTENVYRKLEDKLQRCINEEKIFTQKNMNLSSLSSILETNANYLSQLINNQFNTNFNDFINSYRIKEACSIMMKDPDLKYSIDQVADMVGFSSRSTFYSTFKKFTGITPAFFQKNLSTILEHKHKYDFLKETES